MTKELLISQLRVGKNGQQILDILDELICGMDYSECDQITSPTLEEIEF